MTKQIRIFIGSSAESLKEAKALASELKHIKNFRPTGWWASSLAPRGTDLFLNKLYDTFKNDYDAFIFVANADDTLIKRKVNLDVCRDNVLFEIGMAIGIAGRDRVFIATPKYDGSKKLSWPSDLIGANEYPITVNATKENATKAEIDTAIGTTIEEIKTKLDSLDWKSITSSTECSYSSVVVSRRAELKVSHDAKSTKKAAINDDVSDLFFLLMSPADCETCFSCIDDFVTDNAKIYDAKLEAVYDLAGAWDLMVRFRLKKNYLEFVKNLKKHLIEHNHISESQSDPFGRWRAINVTHRGASLKAVAGDKISSGSKITQTYLKPAEYHPHRASRGFILIEAPTTFGTLETLVKKIDDRISRADEHMKNQCYGIIEAVSLAGDCLLLETFSSCSESNNLNLLNKTVAQAIANTRCQKHTLTVYEYRLENNG